MTLAATDLGLGSCWVFAFDAKKCHEVLGLPEKKRKSLNDIVSWEGYDG